MIAGDVVISDIDIEKIFPFVTDDGERLDLCQVDVVEREDGEHL